MLAKIGENAEGYIARFDRTYEHSVQEVWSVLTTNEKLSKWFSELRIVDLQKGGIITFDMQDGSFEEMNIIEVKEKSVFEFTWGEDQVRFELNNESAGCQLVLIEKITTLTPHTPKDLAGWHVCLDKIQNVLNQETVHFDMEIWRKHYEEYKSVLSRYQD